MPKDSPQAAADVEALEPTCQLCSKPAAPCPTRDYEIPSGSKDKPSAFVAVGFRFAGQASGLVPVLCPACQDKLISQAATLAAGKEK